MEYHKGEPLQHMGDLPDMGADRYPDNPALIFQGEEQTYDDLKRRSNQVANMLKANGVQVGDRVGLYVPNTKQFPEAYFGTIKRGAVPIPLNLRLDPETLKYVLEDADVDHMIASPILAEDVKDIKAAPKLAREANLETVFMTGMEGELFVDYEGAVASADETFDRPDRGYDDVAIQPYTSGTTGKPKGVLLTHQNLLTAINSIVRFGIIGDPNQTILLVLPLFHIYALNAILGGTLYNGATIVLQAVPDPEGMLELIDEYNVDFFPAVPAIFNMISREYRENPEKYDVSSLKLINSAAAPLADKTRRMMEEEWDVNMMEGWGMSETAPAGTLQPIRGVSKEAGCIGLPVDDIEIKLVDPDTRETIVPFDEISSYGGRVDQSRNFDEDDECTGEIAVRGPQVFKGYHNLPEQTEEVFDDDGWFYTQDIARIDEEGFLWMVDRYDDMIIAGGENIYPAEVENALYEHDAVEEAAVVGAPHEIKGEAPVAFAVLEEDAEVDEEELRKFSLDYLATYAHPRRVFFVDELPRSGTEKVQRFKLEEEAKERLDGPLSSSSQL
ncbi:MAG: class I adenylate-forming enzyme family protein [bacterium]